MTSKIVFLVLFLMASVVTSAAIPDPTLDSLYARALKIASSNLDSTERLGEFILKRALEERNFEFAGKGAFILGSVNDVEKKVLNAGMRYYQALQYLRKSEIQDNDLIISILISLGRINGLAGRTSEGIKHYKEALDLCGDCGRRSLIIYNIGYRLYTIQRYDSALINLFDSYELSLAEKNYKRAANCLNYIGLCNHYVGNTEKAREYYYKILNAETYLGDQYRESAAWAWHNIGFSYFDDGDLDGALVHYNKALEIKTTLADTTQKFTTLLDIGEIKLLQAKTDESILYLEKAAQIYSVTNHTPETLKVYDFLERAYSKKDPVKHRFYLDRMKTEYSNYIVRMEDLRKENLAYEMERLQTEVAERLAQYEKIEKWMARAYLIAPIIIIIGLILFFIYKRNQKQKHREILKLISEI